MKDNLQNIIVIGDKVLIKPAVSDNHTKGGLFLPPGVKEKEAVQKGYIVKVGPGYPIPLPKDADESWKKSNKEPEYIPLQAKEGDLAIYLQRDAYEIEYNNDKFFIVPQNAILLLIREDF